MRACADNAGGRWDLAEIRVEQVIRDDYLCDVLEIMELYCSLLSSRFGLVDAVKHCDVGIREAVATIVWAAPHLEAEVAELKVVAKYFDLRYGKEFSKACLENHPRGDGEPTGWVSQRVIDKLKCNQPKKKMVYAYLRHIKDTYAKDVTLPQKYDETVSRPRARSGPVATRRPMPPCSRRGRCR